jgi:hypothetical protein
MKTKWKFQVLCGWLTTKRLLEAFYKLLITKRGGRGIALVLGQGISVKV